MDTKKSGRQKFYTLVEYIFIVLGIVVMVIYIIAFLIQALGIRDMGITVWNELTTLLAISSGSIALAHSHRGEQSQPSQVPPTQQDLPTK